MQTSELKRLSVLIPCYNERHTIEEIVRQIRAVETGLDAEIIVVDDGSTDGSRDVIEHLGREGLVKPVFQPGNMGKGAAVQRALQEASGDVMLVQDADLEYDPTDYPALLRPILRGRAKVVYGSRFLGAHKAMYFWHSVGNKLLTLMTNILYDTTLTDMETGYKVFTADVARRIRLSSPRWGFDPEITARI
ncbi:MAG: glycosyltransferase, partial [Chloroflexi bacterium]|nr:glycosyltransferase [Chloroflexota bacterium]